jgi:amino acid adenylation domain-containing protein
MAASVYRASSMQRQFWLLWQLSPDGTAYNVPSLFHLRGSVDLRALAQAIANLANRHPVLRTTFDDRDGTTWAQVWPSLSPEVLSLENPVAHDDPTIRAVFTAPFDLRMGPLYRAMLAPALDGGHWLALTFHHVCMDLRSKALIAADLSALYAHYARRVRLPALPAMDYATAAAEEDPVVEQLIAGGGLDYFASHLATSPPPLALPLDRARGKTQPTRGDCLSLEFSHPLVSRLREKAAELRTKPFVPLLATWAVLLARMSAASNVCVSVPFTNRRRESWQNVVGCFVNNLPLAVNVEDHAFDAIVAQVRADMLTHHRHQEIPMARIVDRVKPERDPSRNPIFQAGFTFEPPMDLRLDGATVQSLKVHAGGSQLDVFMNLWETESGFAGHIEYATDLYDAETIARLGRNYFWLLQEALDHGDRPAVALEFPEPAEKTRVLSDFNATQVDFRAPAGLHDLFLAQADRTPNAVALSMGDKILTYSELRAKALTIAAALREDGVKPGDLVGVYMHRSIELPVTLLAVLFSGAAYVPIDPDYPADRVRNMIEDAKVERVLAHAATAETWPGDPSLLRRVESFAATTPATPHAAGAGDCAYVIFTSGSTGRPKGAANTHAGIVNRILWMQAEYRLGPDDVVLQKTPYGFDVSTWEFFWPIVAGARLEIAPPGIHRDPLALATLIQSAHVTTIHFVPSMLQAFLDHPDARNCRGLRRIIASGEALSAELVKRCLATLPAPLFNLYGPTEAAVDVTAWACQQDPTRDPVPIGKPIANTRMYVLDRRGQPVPIGVPGEIFIGGVQVGAGYVNRPELTAERFASDPFSQAPGARLYRTGDVGRWDPDGQLVYLGRLDHQVKIRGLRIELGEIESVLDRFPAVRQSVVIAHPPDSPSASIVAYLAATPSPTLVTELRAHAAKALPPYMVPSHFVVLDALPLSSNGKVDRKALPAPSVPADEASVPPKGEIETWLAAEWGRLLRGASIGRDRNVFDLGGNSVMIASLAGRAKERFGVDVPLVRFFEFPTVEGLAAHLSATGDGRSNPGTAALDAAAERAQRRRAGPSNRPRG